LADGEVGGPFPDALVEFAIELFDFEAGLLLRVTSMNIP
jgi:hypothetical protein